MYNTVLQLCQFFCCGRKVNFVRTPYSQDCFSNISRTFFVKKMIPYKTYVREDQLFLALYGSTTKQSLLFLKTIENFVWFPKQYLLGFFILEKQLANILDRGFLYLCNTLLLHSLLLWRKSYFSTVYTLLLYSLDPYRWNDRQRNKYTCFAWAGGTFFSVVLLCCASFWLWWEKGFDLHMHVLLRVPYSCGVVLVILVLAGNSFCCYAHT